MQITDQKKIAAIKKEFQSHFPYLKLEFYYFPHGEGDGSPSTQLVDPQQTIGSIRTIHNKGDLGINGHQKVSTLEKKFRDIYGLNVQVFRQSGPLWLQTTATDEWTLAEQNKKGEASIKFTEK